MFTHAPTSDSGCISKEKSLIAQNMQNETTQKCKNENRTL